MIHFPFAKQEQPQEEIPGYCVHPFGGSERKEKANVSDLSKKIA